MPQINLIGISMPEPHEVVRDILHRHLQRLIVLTNFSERKLLAMGRPPGSASDDKKTGRNPSLTDYLVIIAALDSIDPADAMTLARYPLDYLKAVAEAHRPGAKPWDAGEAGRELVELGGKAGVALLTNERNARQLVTDLRDAADKSLLQLHAGKLLKVV